MPIGATSLLMQRAATGFALLKDCEGMVSKSGIEFDLSKVNLDTLNMSDYTSCILAQSTGLEYLEALTELYELVTGEPYDLEFYPWEHRYGFCTSNKLADELTQAWVFLIKADRSLPPNPSFKEAMPY